MKRRHHPGFSAESVSALNPRARREEPEAILARTKVEYRGARRSTEYSTPFVTGWPSGWFGSPRSIPAAELHQRRIAVSVSDGTLLQAGSPLPM
jgi:hypothetical protein